MPVYHYRCKECKEEFEIKHSMSFDQKECIYCKSENILRVPCISEYRPDAFQSKSSSRPGKIVDKYIEDTKREINDEKNRIKREEL